MSAPAAVAAPGAVSVVIPVLNAAAHLPALVPALLAQAPRPPLEIILVDSGSTDATLRLAAGWPQVRVVTVDRFSHGRARNLGARAARGEFIALLSQDALPRDPAWLAGLLAPLAADPRVAAAFSRQVPRPDANPMERYFLQSHFPAGAPIRMQQDAGAAVTFQKGLFFSNVSAVIRRSVLLEHPFDEAIIMSEDQQFARDALAAGHAIVYQPDSVVVHSHNYSLRVAFQRYFDSVYSLTEIFAGHDLQASAALGLRYVWGEFLYVARAAPWYLPYYALYTTAKAGGTFAAHHARRMPLWLVRRCSLHKYHWDRPAAAAGGTP